MLLDYFPRDCLPEPRQQQILAINAIEQALNSGKKFIAVEAPVGSGKSGIALTLGRWSGNAFILTPSKSLQTQYLRDFPDVRLSKGRGSVPCTFGKPDKNQQVIKLILNGNEPTQPHLDDSCAKGPCMGTRNGTRKRILAECNQSGPCPYDEMLDVAGKAPIVVMNYHSMFYQTYMAGKFDKRKIMVLDEAHDTEGFLRSMLSIKFTVPRMVATKELSHLKTVEHWATWLKRDEQLVTIKRENQERYLGKIEKFEAAGKNCYGDELITNRFHFDDKFKIEFIPNYVGNAAREFLFNFADIVVLMSGTMYDKGMFLNPLGISTSEAAFIRLDSDFPVANRPVVLPRNKTLDLSHKNWDKNFPQAIKEIQHILEHHKNDKGLIHVNSYQMAAQITEALNSERIVSHQPEDFSVKLDGFFKSKEPNVFISPVCNQGVDFKDDLARFSIGVRPPHTSMEDAWVKSLLAKGRWDIYFYKTLIIFGQQTGRCVRSKTDTSVFYTLSSTYTPFLNKVKTLMPKWFVSGLVK